MINMYLAGAKLPTVAEDVLRLGGYNRLYSQFNDRSAIKEYANERTGLLLIDSGAYTAHKKDVDISVDDYINYLNENTKNFDYFIQLDTIPGKFGKPKTKEDYLVAAKQSFENFEYMLSKLEEPDKLMPVFHFGDDMKHLKTLLEYRTPTGNLVSYLGVSPANDTGVGIKATWIDKVFNCIKTNNREDIKTHALGMTSLDVLDQYPFTSADSTSWKLSAAYGSIITPYGPINISSVQGNNKKSIHNHKDKGFEVVEEYIKSKGYTVEDLAANFNPRALFNAQYIKEWAENSVVTKTNNYKKSLF